MKIDIRGRVDNLKLATSHGLRPVFEAIANSIQAIEDRAGDGGRISIIVRRDASQGVLRPDARKSDAISEFEICDNGVGFNNQNFESFNTSDTRYKADSGGKGIGRLLWLKAFSKVTVVSVFESNRQRFRRSFNFNYSETGVEDVELAPESDRPIETCVKLIGFKAEYRNNCPKSLDVIAQRIIEHCLEFLALDACPRMTLEDETTRESIDLNSLFSDILRTKRESFDIRGKKFRIIHVMTPPRQNEKHSVYFCAHSRAVITEQLAGVVPNLEVSLTDPERDRPFIYSGYISSPVLDERVVAERTRFDFPEEGDLVADADLGWPEVRDVSIDKAAEFLLEFTEAMREQKETQIREFVEREAPQYRPLLKHKPQAIDRIPPNLSPEKLDVELYRLNQEYDLELQQRYREILGDRVELDEFGSFEQHYAQFLEEWNERGMSTLAKYVTHRKATLDFLRYRLEAKEDGSYHREEAIHEVVFPLRATSDDVPPERMNLWILDETLAYHYYLASDQPLRSAKPIETNSKKELDILIFNKPIVFAEGDAPQFDSIVIVEFKRPLRDDYSDKENPIDQVVDYVELLRSGKAKTRHGRLIEISESLPIHVLIICDFTEKLKRLALSRNFHRTAGKQQFYMFHNEYSAFIEIMSFDAMLDKAERRNRVLFDKLGLKGEAFRLSAGLASAVSDSGAT